jgi:LAGLIDADG DNA endonuclease family
MGIYYKNIFDLRTSISLIGKKNYTTLRPDPWAKANTSYSRSKKRLTKVERSKINIGEPLNKTNIGLLLGDGHIQSRQLNGKSRFRYGQSSLRENHLNYFNHIFELFKPFISKEYKIKSRSFLDNRNNKTYSSVIFATLTLPCLTFYRELFYNSQGKKIVPLNINQ